jgi:uncharacterized protein (DUF1015 family)
VPEIRAFRALRYDPEVVGDHGLVVAPPCHAIGPDLHRRLLARHPLNAVRLELPEVVAGEDPDERYRRVARTLTAWRSDGALRKDPKPSVYAYEQAYRVPGTSLERTRRGFFARLRIEPFGPGSSVLPHERTTAGPREDRYRLLRATGLNTSPIVGLYEDAGREAQAVLGTIVQAPPAVDLTDDAGVRHRTWVVPDEGEGTPASRLIAAASAGEVVVADGHHRYEAAVRYRDERRVNQTGEQDPAFDFLLMLFLDAADPLTVLPMHRVLRGLGEEALPRLVGRLPELFTVVDSTATSLADHFAAVDGQRGRDGRLGLVTRSGAWLLEARPDAFGAIGRRGGTAVRALAVSRLGTALEALAGIGANALADGSRIGCTTSAAEAVALVEAATDGADAAFLLEPVPVASIFEVARAGDVMPPNSTYPYPKALTGLLFNPHEW